MKKLLLFFILIPFLCDANGLKVNGLFTNNMVLQHGVPVPVWGSSEAGQVVKVQFAGQIKTARTSENGKWLIYFDPLQINSTPQNMIISDNYQEVKISDILVGEVWLCSGQSNMGMVLNEANNAENAISTADYPEIRLFNVPERPAEEKCDDVKGKWVPCSPDVAGSFSATAFFFGKKLYEELDVPIGLLVSAWGGSTACAWTSNEWFKTSLIDPMIPDDVLGWRINTRPAMLYNGMLFPLAPFSVKGVVWYQGESDAEYANSYTYRYIFPNMIQCWRDLWKWTEMPFYYVQLPNIGRKDNSWTILRESQSEALKLNNTGMINTIDIGDEKKLHPANKKDFSDRLANFVLAKEYGKDVQAGYPVFDSFSIEKNKLIVSFKNTNTLVTNGGEAPACFEIAGEDSLFVPANAKISKNKIILQADGISPRYVRYAFESNPPVNLYNEYGLPVFAFRTDSFPVEHQDRMPQIIEKAENISTVKILDIVKGEKTDWYWAGDGIENDFDLFVKNRFIKELPDDHCQLFVMSRPHSFTTLESPVLAWKKDLSASLKKLSVELSLHIFRSTAPLTGFNICLNANGKSYSIIIAPMRIYAMENKEVIILEKNLDNATGYNNYRISLREDGIAQIYFNDNLIGLIEGEQTQEKENSILIGKTIPQGNMTISLNEISIAE